MKRPSGFRASFIFQVLTKLNTSVGLDLGTFDVYKVVLPLDRSCYYLHLH